jgi:DNA repair protein RadC
MADGGKARKTRAPSGAAEGPVKHYHAHRERPRPRQRLREGDGSHLADYELLELLLCAFIPRVDVKPIAKEMIARLGSVSGALAAPPERLKEISGVGESAAVYICAAHLLLQRAAGDEVKDRPVISNRAALLKYVKLALRHETSEPARVLYLHRKNKLIADEIIGRTTVDHAPVYPREIAKRALELAASAVILAHNHPNGLALARRHRLDPQYRKALVALEIKLHDHFVVGAKDTVSMKAKGLI